MRVAGALLFVILLSMAGELQPARAALPEAEQVFFVPLPEATVDAALTAVGATTTGTMHSVISITAVADDTIIYYDEWEDGFEPVLEEPAQSSTQIWGDEDPSNGIPPGFATDVIDAGDIVVLEDDVALPRDPGTLEYDGGDRFGATSPIAATRAVWDLGIGTVAAGAVEVSNVATYGTAYEVPAGVDFLYPSATDQMFEYTSLVITAAEDGTTVGIDVDADGTDDVTVPLDQGETHQVDGGVLTGATVTASAPVQVQLITGDIGARFETRFYNLVPTSAWNSTYYTPVGSSAANETVVVLYNPDTAALTVDAQTLGGSVPVVVPAGGAAAYVMPVDSGGRFTSSDGRPFEALSGIDTDDGNSTAHDWGFTLLPSSSLTASALAGWGPGSSDLTGNGSPVWVTAVGATRIYVDYDGDPTTGLLTDPNGSGYDAHTDVSAFESLKLFDTFNGDNDQTGTRAYTVDGTLIAAAWGQDPDTAGPGNPYLDLGTTILPVPLFNVFKSVDITNDVNGNGYAEIGDTLRYTIRVSNDGPTSESFVILEDDLPVTTGYVENSTTVDGAAVPDDAVGTPSPFDEGGLDIGTIPPFSSRLVAFDALILSLPPGGEEISNEVTVNGSATVTDDADIPAGGAACAADLTNDSFSPVSIHVEGQTVYARVTDPDESGSVTAQITSSASGDTETVVLTETGADTGVFTGSVPSSPLIGGAAEDGTLLAEAGETIGLDHTDPDDPDDTCSATVTVVPPAAGKPLYLSEPGQGLDRVDPVASGDVTTASSLVLDAVVDVDNLLDSFTTNQSFGGSDGSVPWVPDWQELGESDGPANGLVEVESRAGCPTSNDICLEIAGTGVDLTGLGASRAADLSGAYSATLSFDYATNTDTGSVGLEVRPDGAVSWIPLATYALNPSRTGSASFDITSYISPNTEIRFIGSGSTAAFGGFYVDEVDIAWQTVTPSSTTFTQTDPMVMDFSVLSGQTAQVTAVVDVTTGSISSPPDVTATLSDGTTAFATLPSPSVTPLGGSTYELDWTGVVPADFTVTTGNRVSLEISTSEPGLAFQVLYDSATSPSQIILPTSTYISVDAVDAYDAAFPGGAPITNPAVGQVVHLRVTASDPFGPADITGLDLTVQDGCAGSPTAVSLDETDVVATTASSKTYEYAYTVPPGCFEDFTVLAVAFEGTEGITDSDSTTIGIDARPVLAVAKSGPAAALLGDTITYTFAVSHDAGSDGSPVAGLSVTDDVAGGAAYVSGDDGDGLLEAGETWSYTADYTTSGTDPDPLDNTVSVSGTDVDGEAVGPATDTHSLDIRVAELQVIKTDTVNGTGVAGDTVDYEITVTSTGLVTVSNIAVSDGLADVDGPCRVCRWCRSCSCRVRRRPAPGPTRSRRPRWMPVRCRTWRPRPGRIPRVVR